MSTNTYKRLVGAVLMALLVTTPVQRYIVGRAAESTAGTSAPIPGTDTSSATLPSSHTDEMPGMAMPPGNETTPGKPSALPPGYAGIRVAGQVQQRIGVTLGRVERTPLTMAIRTVGIITADETRVAQIHVKTEGWVEKLYVAYTGQQVRAGDPLLTIYSPAFFSAQREFLTALQAVRTGVEQPEDQQLVATARRRLELWDIPADEIEALEKSGKPRKSLTLRSPISGTILQKHTFAGQYVMPQNDLYVVGDLSVVWMQARVFQYELPHVALGMPATVSFPSSAGSRLSGKVVFIDPVLDEMSRSVQVRIELSNAKGQLRPGMFGDVTIEHAMGVGLTVPASAVIRTGERNIVFRVDAEGRFTPVDVKISSLGFGDRFEVLAGLAAGDQIVTSGNFLIDSESRLEAGANSMAGMPGMGPQSQDNGMADTAGMAPPKSGTAKEPKAKLQ